MKRHLTASTRIRDTRSQRGASGGLAAREPETYHDDMETAHAVSAPAKPRLALASVRTRVHTLVLTGELTHRSAHTLEAEMERLYEEGVTGITLDLRQLEYIDSIGVAVIAFRAGLSGRRGYDFELIPGPRPIHEAFAEAGQADLLPFREDDVAEPLAIHPPATSG